MPKPTSPRNIKASNGPAASRHRASPAPSANGRKTAMAPTLSHEALAARAYALFLARGGQPGNDLGDWLQAEAELRQEMERAVSTPRE